MFACLPYSLGWLMVFMSTSVYHLYFSRLLVGVSHALLTTTVYTVEISSKEMRGTYSLLESVLRCFGCLLIYTLGFAFRWRQIAMFAPLVPLLAFISAVFLAPESPVFLLAKKRYFSIMYLPRGWIKKNRQVQKLANCKKSTILIWSSWYSSN